MKRILLTVISAFTEICFAAMLFFNTILAAFGLVTTSVEAMNDLRSSKKIAEQMKTQHKEKKGTLPRK
jgi:hypothetical protein